MSKSGTPHVLVLGAGINGAAIARELALNGVDVTLFDSADLAFGATAYSSRLIHGGLRYLEYGEFDLVRESLEERSRLLRLAPQFVRPLRLFIPTSSRFGGLWTSARRFLRIGRGPRSARPAPARGVWLVHLGLWMYDRYARSSTLPKHEVHQAADGACPKVDAARYRWLCSYYDAQIMFPERFVVALVEDARQLAADSGRTFRFFNYHHARLAGDQVEVRRGDGDQLVDRFRASAVINATGAWVDETLTKLGVDAKRLMGGTKGSHFITWHRGLRQAVEPGAIYAEADDGRPIFILPFGDAVLVGTTDERFEGDPAAAIASDEEIYYLIRVVNVIFPDLGIGERDVAVRYSGVRPLPYTGPGSTAGITRRHWLEPHPGTAIPTYSVIGGKLTTCRSLAETSARTILERLGMRAGASSRDRIVPGACDYAADERATEAWIERLAHEHQSSQDSVRAMMRLCGTRTSDILGQLDASDLEVVADTALPRAFVRWVIRHEWVAHLADLVERRLMLVYHRRLTLACLAELADLMVAEGKLSREARERELNAVCRRLETHFARRLNGE